MTNPPRIDYLSFSSLTQLETNPDEFVLRRLTDAPRPPQTQPMAVGSAFDAYVKSHIADIDFETLFEKQVEEHNREWAREAGQKVWWFYRSTDAYQDLLDLLDKAQNVQIEERKTRDIDGVPILGVADLAFDGLFRVELDWKVRGYCSKSGASPTPGYMLCDNQQHIDFWPREERGIRFNERYLEWHGTQSELYASQLATYAWLDGVQPGSEEFLGFVEEIICRPSGMRIAQHRARISQAFQVRLLDRYKRAWQAVTDDHLFSNLSLIESRERVAMLVDAAGAFNEAGALTRC